MTATINASNSGSGGLISTGDASGSLALQTAGTTAVTIDTSQNVGIGTTPQTWTVYDRVLQLGTGSSFYTYQNTELNIATNAYYNGGQKYIGTGTSARYQQANTGAHIWYQAGSGSAGGAISYTQAMTLDSSGNLLVGQTADGSSTPGGEIASNGKIRSTLSTSTNSTDTLDVYSTGASAYRFYVGMGGTVYATSTTITAISDQRFKENIVDLPEGLNAVMALKPRRFDWKTGKGKDIKGDRGFIAQEFETVFPDMVEEWKDPAPEGEEPYKAVNANLIPTLVKAIQELKAINDQQAETINAQSAALAALTARVVAIESRGTV